ncbi:solute carrier family 22 member 15-like [Bolinopsis microptera]|uniref:solute carrier family 22 member 15-like n=1 Tax=Bolinopsis microptera TaxID=2820187 RepID=UPI0030796513
MIDEIKAHPTYGSTLPVEDTDRKLVSCDDLLEELARNRSWKYTALLMSLMLVWLGGTSNVFITEFAGIDPTPDDTWKCKSIKCFNLTRANPSLLHKFPCEITNEVDGKKELILGSSDIEWSLEHSSFSAEFDLYCDVGFRKARKTLLMSILFAGGLSGFILGGYLFDRIGRKNTAIIGMFIVTFSLLMGTFCHNYASLLAVRFFVGVGNILQSDGMYLLTAELVPSKHRHIINGWAGCLGSFGYVPLVGIGYFVISWNNMFLAASIVMVLTSLQIFICPESPRYYLIKNDVEAAKKSFKALAKLNNMDLDLENIQIIDAGKAKDRNHNVRQQLTEFIRYPSLLLETSILMVIWPSIAMFSYGFGFGWGDILPDRYLGYIMAGVGEIISYFMSVSLIDWQGRRHAMIFMFLGAALTYLTAIPNVEFGSGWTLESVSCLIGAIFVNGLYSGILLWTGELAPTTHRGIVFSFCSGISRVGSFTGPFLFNNLALITSKAVVLGSLAFISVFCMMGSFLLVETRNKPIPVTGQDVEERRNGRKN